MDRYFVDIAKVLRPAEAVWGGHGSILLVSIPKSGTIYMRELLIRGLGLKPLTVSNEYFPEDQLRLNELEEFHRGGRIASTHIDPSAVNLQLLDAFVQRWVVHIRDPRSVLLSWTHHLARLFGVANMHALLKLTPTPPPEYHLQPIEWRIDWNIQNFLPSVVAWTQDWVKLADRYPDRILLTEFADLRENELDFMTRLVSFGGYPEGCYKHPALDKTMALHFRNGHLDEWRTAFSADQLARADEHLPADLCARFGWS